MSDIAIKVENISKKYQIGENKTYPTLRDKLMELPSRLFKGPKKNKEFWALQDVSFEVKKGEVVGIIGRNGAGKSTMLKILARITEPTSGKITMYGRVASMLEVGTGFNPELTGRENIYLNGAIIGMKKVEIEQKFSDIVAFSGVEKFLDTPVKHYSSGMYVRLAFAVSAHLDADILLVDEVLAVGDAEFQKKCLGKMSDLARSGRTVILVSHNMSSIQQMCKKSVYLEDGMIKIYDNTAKVMQAYANVYTKKNTENSIYKGNNPELLVKKITIKNSSNKISNSVIYGERVSIIIETNSQYTKEFGVELRFRPEKIDYPVAYLTSFQTRTDFFKAGESIQISFINRLFPGTYIMDFIFRKPNIDHCENVWDKLTLIVNESRVDSIPYVLNDKKNLGYYLFDSEVKNAKP